MSLALFVHIPYFEKYTGFWLQSNIMYNIFPLNMHCLTMFNVLYCTTSCLCMCVCVSLLIYFWFPFDVVWRVFCQSSGLLILIWLLWLTSWRRRRTPLDSSLIKSSKSTAKIMRTILMMVRWCFVFFMHKTSIRNALTKSLRLYVYIHTFLSMTKFFCK